MGLPDVPLLHEHVDGLDEASDLHEIDGQVVAFEGADGTEHTIDDDQVRRGSGGGCGGSLRDHEWTEEELGYTFKDRDEPEEK